MVTVFNNFSSMTRSATMPKLDVLMWIAGLCRCKSFGYRTKLYCAESDIPFLKENRLFGLYDEIDSETLEGEASEALAKVNGKRFWSTRKFECMRHEWLVLGNSDSVYSDTDVLMKRPFDLSGDALAWSPEERKKKTIYVPWGDLSSPPGYEMPDFVAKTDDAYNCGVLWFRYAGTFRKWYDAYHAWADGNPCLISPDIKDGHNNLFACNGEQRILKAVLDDTKADVRCVMPESGRGLSEFGYHWYWYRVIWKMISDAGDWPKADEGSDALMMMNFAALESLGAIGEFSPALRDEVCSDDWLKGFEIREEEGRRRLYGYLDSYE